MRINWNWMSTLHPALTRKKTNGLTELPLGRSVLHYFLLLNGKAPGHQLVCHVHMAQNVRGCWRSQITSEVQFGVYRKTQCSSNTNWIAAECGRLKLTMQYLGDWVNSTTQLIFKAHLKMIFCCSFTTAHIAPVAIFCPAALNSVLQTPSS